LEDRPDRLWRPRAESKHADEGARPRA